MQGQQNTMQGVGSKSAEVYLAQRKNLLEQRLRDSGEEARLEDYLRQKLIEAGWKDDLKNYCKEQIRQKGLEKVTIDELTDQLQLRGQATIPNKIKEDLLARLRNFFEENPI